MARLDEAIARQRESSLLEAASFASAREQREPAKEATVEANRELFVQFAVAAADALLIPQEFHNTAREERRGWRGRRVVEVQQLVFRGWRVWDHAAVDRMGNFWAHNPLISPKASRSDLEEGPHHTTTEWVWARATCPVETVQSLKLEAKSDDYGTRWSPTFLPVADALAFALLMHQHRT